MSATRCSSDRRPVVPLLALCLLAMLLAPLLAPTSLLAQTPAPASAAPAPHAGGGEASLRMPDVGSIQLMGVNGRTLLLGGLVVCVLGLALRPRHLHGSSRTCPCTSRCGRSPS